MRSQRVRHWLVHIHIPRGIDSGCKYSVIKVHNIPKQAFSFLQNSDYWRILLTLKYSFLYTWFPQRHEIILKSNVFPHPVSLVVSSLFFVAICPSILPPSPLRGLQKENLIIWCNCFSSLKNICGFLTKSRTQFAASDEITWEGKWDALFEWATKLISMLRIHATSSEANIYSH